MKRSRRRCAERGVKLALGILAVVALALMVWLLGRGVLRAVQAVGSGGPTSVDPQFREEAETVTRPPEAEEAPGLGREDTDPSADWVVEEEGPVDQTAEELAREALENGEN